MSDEVSFVLYTPEVANAIRKAIRMEPPVASVQSPHRKIPKQNLIVKPQISGNGGSAEYKGPFALRIVERDGNRYIRMENTSAIDYISVGQVIMSPDSMCVINGYAYYVQPLEVQVDKQSNSPTRYIVLRARRSASSAYNFSLHAYKNPELVTNSATTLEWVLGFYNEELGFSYEQERGTIPVGVTQLHYGIISYSGSGVYKGDFAVFCEPNEDGSTTVSIGRLDESTMTMKNSYFYVNGMSRSAAPATFLINDTKEHMFYLRYVAPADENGADREESYAIVDSAGEGFVYDEEEGTVIYYPIGSVKRSVSHDTFSVSQRHLSGYPNLTWYYRCS